MKSFLLTILFFGVGIAAILAVGVIAHTVGGPLRLDMESDPSAYRHLTDGGYVVERDARLQAAVREFFSKHAVLPVTERDGIFEFEFDAGSYGIWRRTATPMGYAWREIKTKDAVLMVPRFSFVSGLEAEGTL